MRRAWDVPGHVESQPVWLESDEEAGEVGRACLLRQSLLRFIQQVLGGCSPPGAGLELCYEQTGSLSREAHRGKQTDKEH